MPKENDNRRVTRSQKKAADSTTSDSNDEKSKSPKAKAGGRKARDLVELTSKSSRNTSQKNVKTAKTKTEQPPKRARVSKDVETAEVLGSNKPDINEDINSEETTLDNPNTKSTRRTRTSKKEPTTLENQSVKPTKTRAAQPSKRVSKEVKQEEESASALEINKLDIKPEEKKPKSPKKERSKPDTEDKRITRRSTRKAADSTTSDSNDEISNNEKANASGRKTRASKEIPSKVPQKSVKTAKTKAPPKRVSKKKVKPSPEEILDVQESNGTSSTLPSYRIFTLWNSAQTSKLDPIPEEATPNVSIDASSRRTRASIEPKSKVPTKTSRVQKSSKVAKTKAEKAEPPKRTRATRNVKPSNEVSEVVESNEETKTNEIKPDSPKNEPPKKPKADDKRVTRGKRKADDSTISESIEEGSDSLKAKADVDIKVRRTRASAEPTIKASRSQQRVNVTETKTEPLVKRARAPEVSEVSEDNKEDTVSEETASHSPKARAGGRRTRASAEPKTVATPRAATRTRSTKTITKVEPLSRRTRASKDVKTSEEVSEVSEADKLDVIHDTKSNKLKTKSESQPISEISEIDESEAHLEVNKTKLEEKLVINECETKSEESIENSESQNNSEISESIECVKPEESKKINKEVVNLEPLENDEIQATEADSEASSLIPSDTNDLVIDFTSGNQDITEVENEISPKPSDEVPKVSTNHASLDDNLMMVEENTNANQILTETENNEVSSKPLSEEIVPEVPTNNASSDDNHKMEIEIVNEDVKEGDNDEVSVKPTCEVFPGISTKIASSDNSQEMMTEITSAKRKLSEVEREEREEKGLIAKRRRSFLLSVPPVPATYGKLLTCGEDISGQLGLGETGVIKKTPFYVDIDAHIASVSCGALFTICLTNEGTVYSFGCNDECALGRTICVDSTGKSTETLEATPEIVTFPSDALLICKVTAGDSHASALSEDGRVFMWGTFRDNNGVIGLLKGREKENIKSPTLLPHLPTQIVDVASGSNHIMLLTNEGQIYSMGIGEKGALGRIDGFTKPSEVAFNVDKSDLFLRAQPVIFSDKSLLFDKVWAGEDCSFARSMSGDIYAWGLNNYNQLGFTAGEVGRIVEYFPCKVDHFVNDEEKKIEKICSGQHHSIALDTLGRVYSFGRHEYGRLGCGNCDSDRVVPTLINHLANEKIIDIACGATSSFAVSDKGVVYAWGMASHHIGDDDNDLWVPTKMRGRRLEEASVISASSGSQHLAIITASRNENGDH